MTLDCFCGRNDANQRNLFTVKVQLLDNTISEYSLNKKSTGLDCLKRIAQEVNLKELSAQDVITQSCASTCSLGLGTTFRVYERSTARTYAGISLFTESVFPYISHFGLKYICNELSVGKWLDLNKNLHKEIKRLCADDVDDVVIYFQIRFFTTDVESLNDDTIRYFYYLQLRQNVQDGVLYCSEEEAIALASYALQAEYGDYDASEHKENFIQEYQLLPTDFQSEKSNAELYAEIAERHKNYVGMSTTVSEFSYIKCAHHLQCYGHEFHPAKDTEGRSVSIGPCARGVFLKYDSETPFTYFNWPDIVKMVHSKKQFSVETSSLKSLLEMGSIEDAKYVWQMCVDHHQFYRIGDSKKDICGEEGTRQKGSSPAKRNSSTVETSNGYSDGGEGLCNPAFNDSTLPEQNESDLESKRTSRESGIYASSESRVDKQEDIAPVPSTSRALQSDVLNNNDNDIPADLLMASYKTFDNQPRSRHHIDTHARRSYPRAITHSTGAGGEKTGQPVERSVSMIVSSTTGENCVDACSLQTMATSGYSTSTDSGLSNTKSPALSPMSPVSLISSSSFNYDDYEVPSADEQCKQLEAVINGGCLDVEFARIKLKDEQRSTASACLPKNQTKNRYQDIIPYEESRVLLDSSNNSSKNDYINASFIKVKVSNKPFIYIATQAPIHSTASDFLQMVWEQNVRIIVMLYNKKDGSQECYRYWPKDKSDTSENLKREFEEFEVTTQFVNKSSCYKSRGLKLRHIKQEQEKTIILLQFSHWPHNGVPNDASVVLDFMAEVESLRNEFLHSGEENTPSPVVVHCRSGVGRTGVFVLADLMIGHLQNPFRQPFNVARVLSKLRSQRMSLIRTVDQYRFVYALLIQYLKNSRLI